MARGACPGRGSRLNRRGSKVVPFGAAGKFQMSVVIKPRKRRRKNK